MRLFKYHIVRQFNSTEEYSVVPVNLNITLFNRWSVPPLPLVAWTGGRGSMPTYGNETMFKLVLLFCRAVMRLLCLQIVKL